MRCVVHLLSGLEVGGKERVALDLAARGRALGLDHRLLVYDAPFREAELDFDPGDVPVEFLPRSRGLDLGFARRVARFLEACAAGVVHAHNDSALVYGVLASRFMKRPRAAVVATFHTRPSHTTRAARLATRWASGRAGRVVAVADTLGAELVATRWVKDWITVWNGVDLDAFGPDGGSGSWRRRLGIPGRAVLVGHVGRFDPIKRHRDLLATARALAGHDPPIHFVLAGRGPLLEELRAVAADLDHVHFVPRVLDVAEFLRALDVFALCSRHEAAPLAMLEAMACARAIVATAVGGVPHLLNAGEQPCGMLVPPEHPEELARAIADLATGASLRRDLGIRARQRAESFSADRVWNRYDEIYGQVTASGPADRGRGRR